MDKIIKLGVEAKLNETMIQRIETLCYNGTITSDKAVDLIAQQLERFNKRWKEIINAPVKVSAKKLERLEKRKQYTKAFMDQFQIDRAFEALNIN